VDHSSPPWQPYQEIRVVAARRVCAGSRASSPLVLVV
jgi:hypothetical protein